MQPLAAVTFIVFLATLNTKIVDYLAAPVKKRYPELDTWWLIYVALATGFALSWIAQANVFEGVVPDVALGRVLTGVLIGGGSSLIHDVVDAHTDDQAIQLEPVIYIEPGTYDKEPV